MPHTVFKEYNVLDRCKIVIGNDLTAHIAADMRDNIKVEAFVLLTDENIAGLHLSSLASALMGSVPGPRVLTYVVPPGEASKTYDTKIAVENFMFANNVPRKACLIALGGGVIGDLAGFIASTYMRGILFVQVPTTLLAMCDSSIGGKTGIDNAFGKNLIGTIYQPVRVYIDAAYLQTLPDREYRNGMAEVIKTAAISSESDFLFLETHIEAIMARTASLNTILKFVADSALTKAAIVNQDERESGLREILNFGHTIGHAIETVLQPEMLHGEAVAIGMRIESELARALGLLSQADTSRLISLLKAVGFNVHIPPSLNPDVLLEKMLLDKKNKNGQINVVLVSRIGAVHNSTSTGLSKDLVLLSLSEHIMVHPPKSLKFSHASPPNSSTPLQSETTHITVTVPGSKSISNRALLMAALARNQIELKGLLFSDDTQVMMDSLNKLGLQIQRRHSSVHITGSDGFRTLSFPKSSLPDLYLGNAGTAARFFTSALTLLPEHTQVLITGDKRMQERPIAALVDTLRETGCEISYKNATGCLPLLIKGCGGLAGGEIELSADISSQYVSSILIASPYAKQPVTLKLKAGKVVSQPYIDMTIQMLEQMGVRVQADRKTQIYRIPNTGLVNPASSSWMIEGDASTASYPLAIAAITGLSVTVNNIGRESLQGDANFYKVLALMGCTCVQTAHETMVTGPSCSNELRPIPMVDMEEMTDTFMTAAALAAVAPGKTTITGIANQRVKECNRIEVMCTELAKLGVQTEELSDGLVIHGRPRTEIIAHLAGRAVYISCHNDHRIAMSFGVLGCLIPNIVITEKHCVEKTFPEFWDMIRSQFGFTLSPGSEISIAAAAAAAAAAPSSSTGFNANSGKMILLIGMRGSGKSFLGSRLSAHLGYQFLELDDEFQRVYQSSIPDFVANHGWPAFREKELALFLQCMETRRHEKWVVSTGGGLIESEGAQSFLLTPQPHISVIHVHREKANCLHYLMHQDTTRPALIGDLEAIFDRRGPIYHSLSHHIYSNSPTRPVTDFFQFIDTQVAQPTATTTLRDELSSKLSSLYKSEHPSYFLSLTLSNYVSALDLLQKTIAGCHFLELRIDLLSSYDMSYIIDQVSFIRSFVDVPLIYTVRSKPQNGRFVPSYPNQYFDLVKLGIKLGCEVIDLEVEQSPRLLKQLLANKQQHNSLFLVSFHQHIAERCLNATQFRAIMAKCSMDGQADAIKVIGSSQHVSDCHQLSIALKDFQQLNPSIPALALLMGKTGVLSRVLNPFLTPVTHPSLSVVAAPGQLSILEIQSLRTQLGLITPKSFYLFGNNIQKSLSPCIHNSNFKFFNLPHTYALMESTLGSDNVSFYSEILTTAKTRSDNFAGASVTIPYKTDVMPYMDKLSSHATAIGAVNTITKTPSGELYGDNTDWIGITHSLNPLLKRDPSFVAQEASVLIIGAGGTSRACIYAMKQLRFKTIYITNRTFTKAADLSREFEIIAIEPNERCLASLAGKLSVIISTVPASEDSPVPELLLACVKKPVILDVSYIRTNANSANSLLSLSKKHQCVLVNGIEMLIHQANAQFFQWTGMHFDFAYTKAAIEQNNKS